MIFQATWQAVLDGSKTETRRIVKPGEQYEPEFWLSEKYNLPAFVRLPSLRHKWQVGRIYAVQPGRGQKAVSRIRLLEIRQERLQDITEAGAIAEGVALQAWAADSYYQFPRTAGYAQLWDSIHPKRGERWADNPLVWVLRFELVKGDTE